MDSLNRRDFTHASLGSLLAFSLVETFCENNLWANEVKPITTKWLRDVNDLGQDLKSRKIGQQVWQSKIEELFKKVDLPDLLKMIDFDKLTKDLKIPDNGARSLRFRFQAAAGAPTEFVFGRQIFALKKGRSVVPHGHNNMATAFLILKGDFHGRHYDRVKDEPQHYIIKPTIDKEFKAGGCTTISDEKDNIHWFKAISEPSFIFNIHVMGITPGKTEPTGRVYLDPEGEKLADGLIRARALGYEEVHKLYG